MELQKPQWAECLKESPFKQSHFTDELRMRIRQKTNRKTIRISYPAIVLTVIAFSVLVLYILKLDEVSPSYVQAVERHAYYNNDVLLFEVYPDPELRAGQSYGYIFHFTAPFEELKGKELEVYAVHLKTGQRVSAIVPMLITEPSSGYQGLERLTLQFQLPIGGYWRYEVVLDGQLYGDVILDVGEPLWEVSSRFQSGSYTLTGVQEKVGFIDPGFIAGHTNKYLWSFWGDNSELDGKVNIRAVKQGDDEFIEVFAGSLGTAYNGADRHMPSSMMLPEPGLWRLLPFIEGRLVESIVVEVE